MTTRVLFIVYSFSMGGGAEKVLSYLINGLESRGGYQVDLLEVHHESGTWEAIPEAVTVLPPVFDETATNPFARLRRGALRRVSAISPALLRRLVRTPKRYDVVVPFNYMIPSLLAKPNERSIMWNHGSIECLDDEPVKAAWQRKAYERADAVVAIADRTARSIVRLCPEAKGKLRIVRNGFPLEAMREASCEPSVSLEHPAVVCLGRLDENKDPVSVVRAFGSIVSQAPSAHLYFIGRGDLEELARAEAYRLGILDRVVFLGYVENPYPLLRQADCVISMSHSEGFQSVFVEGFVFGVPFISTPVGAAEELACACDGGIVIDGEAEAGDAFVALMGKREEASYGEKLQRYASGLSIDAFVDAFERLVSEVLGGTK